MRGSSEHNGQPGPAHKISDSSAALFEAAHIMLTRAVRFSSLKRWALGVAQWRGMKRASCVRDKFFMADLSAVSAPGRIGHEVIDQPA